LRQEVEGFLSKRLKLSEILEIPSVVDAEPNQEGGADGANGSL
jgi:hypothetical protein